MTDFFGGIIAFGIFALCFFAWVTHIVWCFSHAAWALLLAGAIFFPIGIGHGFWLML